MIKAATVGDWFETRRGGLLGKIVFIEQNRLLVSFRFADSYVCEFFLPDLSVCGESHDLDLVQKVCTSATSCFDEERHLKRRVEIGQVWIDESDRIVELVYEFPDKERTFLAIPYVNRESITTSYMVNDDDLIQIVSGCNWQ